MFQKGNVRTIFECWELGQLGKWFRMGTIMHNGLFGKVKCSRVLTSVKLLLAMKQVN